MRASTVAARTVTIAALPAINPAVAAGPPDYPTRPLRLVSPNPPGGAKGVIGWTVAQLRADVVGAEPAATRPQSFERFVREQLELHRKIAKELDVRLERSRAASAPALGIRFTITRSVLTTLDETRTSSCHKPRKPRPPAP